MRGWRPRAGTRGTILAAVSGLALGATFSPYGGPVLPFLAFAPLAAALEPCGRGGRNRFAGDSRAAFAQGVAVAAIGHGIGLYWMVPALSWRTQLAAPLYVLVVGMLGLLGGCASMGAAALRRRGWPVPVALACCWTGFEWVAAHVPGVSYAWLNAGGSLAWHPAAAAGAEVLGARFLTFWTVAVGGVVGGGVRVRPVLLVLGLVAIPLAAGHLRQRAFDRREVIATVAAVQAGHGEGVATGRQLGRWRAPLRELAGERPFDLAIFPERFLDAPLRQPGAGRTTDAGRETADFAAAVGVPVLVGAPDAVVRHGGRDTLWFNATFVQAPGDSLSNAYRKARLVPGLEGAGWFPAAAFGMANRGYARGRDPRPLPLGEWAVGAMVCYDSAYGETARALVRGGADWLAVLSNDDWLDPERPFRVTWAYWQHATQGRLRAIENRISLVQVAATGHTFAVSPGGRGAASALDAGEEGAVILTVSRRGGLTLFTRTGDLLGVLCFLVLAGGVALGRTAPQPGRRSVGGHRRPWSARRLKSRREMSYQSRERSGIPSSPPGPAGRSTNATMIESRMSNPRSASRIRIVPM